MGIKDLNNFLRNKSTNSFVELSSSFFKNEKIAIDAMSIFFPIYVTSYKQVVNKTNVITEQVNIIEVRKIFIDNVIKNIIIRLLKYNIIPFVVFDGVSPIEKKETQNKRSEQKNNKKNEISEFKEMYKELNELEISPEMLFDLKKKYVASCRPSYEDIKILKETLEIMNIPVFTATGEAEKTCSMLCLDRICKAVFSSDTDNYAYGCPLVITEIVGDRFIEETGIIDLVLKVTILENILKDLNMSQNSFTDFCIMCGCDFNSNMKNIGPAKSYNLITELKSIDKLPIEKYNIEILNHHKCRELFSYECFVKCLDSTDKKFSIEKITNINEFNGHFEKLILRDSGRNYLNCLDKFLNLGHNF